LIDRDSEYCTYCGAETKDREFPGERSGPATGSDDRSFRDTRGETGATTARPADAGPVRDQSTERDYSAPRVGVEDRGEPPSTDSTLRTVGVAAGLGILGVLLLVVFSALSSLVLFAFQVPETATLAVATAVGQYLGFMGLGVRYLQRRGYTRADIQSYLGIRRPSIRELGLVLLGWLAIFVMVIVVSLVVQAFLPEPAQNEGASQFTEGATNPAVLAAGVAFMFVVVGPCEEFLYRGIVQNRLRERLSAAPAILIAAAVFASVHVVALSGGDPVAMATTVGILFVPALVLGAMYEYTGNLVVVSLLHGLHNSVILSVVFLGPSGGEAAAFVTTLLSTLPV
jgi:membrane protease YdiL (CAAX protease family)